IGPHPVLARSSLETFKEAKVQASVVPTLRRDADDAVQLADACAHLYVSGAPWRPVAGRALHVDLPPYPFERRRLWVETAAGKKARTLPEASLHPHVRSLERRAKAPDAFEAELALDPKSEPYLADHRVQGLVVFPAAGQLEVVVASARAALGTARLAL